MSTRYRGTAREVRALDAFIKLMRATDAIGAALSRHVEAAGLTLGQLGVLEALLHIGPMSQSELGAKLLRSGSNVTMVLTNLEKQGLVRRTRRAGDRRVVDVALTPAGRKSIERIFPAHARRIATLFAVLPAEDQERLGALCRTLGRHAIQGDHDD